MESRIKKYIQETILEKYPSTDLDLDIDWEQLQIAFHAGIKEMVDIVSKRYGLLRSNDDIVFWQTKKQEWGLDERGL